MLRTNFKQMLSKALVLTVLSLLVLGIPAKAGGDVYQIYLNNKLLTKQLVMEPINLKSLPLHNAHVDDELVIYYSHCGVTGKGRSIAVKDEKGKMIKEWKFADASGSNTGMQIPVKELMQLQKSNNTVQLNLVYSSTELPKGRMLAVLPGTKKSNT